MVAAIFVALLSFHLRPFWSVWTDSLGADLGDPLFVLVVLEWDVHQLREGLPDLWHLPIYHPLEHSLLLSDHLLGTALLAWALTAWVGSLLAAFNLLFFLTFALSAVTTYLVLRASGLGAPASFLGAAAFSLSPFRWTHAPHFQILWMQWIPPTLLLWDRLLARPRLLTAAGFLGCYLLHLCGGAYLAYMIHLPLLVLLILRGATRSTDSCGSRKRGFRRWLRPPALRILIPTGLIAVAACTVVLGPYLLAPLDLQRKDAELRQFGTTLPSLWTPSPRNLYFEWVEPWIERLHTTRDPKDKTWVSEKTLFAGVLPTALAWVGVLAFWRGRHRTRKEPREPPGDPPGDPPVDRSADLSDGSPLGWRRAVLAVLAAVACLAFLTADLYTWAFPLPDPVPRTLRPGVFYDRALAVLGLALIAWAILRRRWLGRVGPAGWSSLPIWPRGVLLVGLVTLLAGFPGFFEPLSDRLLGLDGVRVPARFYAFTSFAVAFFAAAGFEGLFRRWSTRWARALATTALLTFLLVELTPKPLRWQPRPEPSAAHHWIADRDEIDAMLELPLRDPLRELTYMSSLSLHWKPLANGYSGHQPSHYLELRQVCCWPVPEKKALAKIRRMGVRHVLLHSDELRAPWAERRLETWRAAVGAGTIPGVRQVYEDSAGDLIFAIDPLAESGR